MKKGSTRRIPHYRLLLLVLLGLMIPRCGSDVKVTFNLINPCKSDILFGEGCQFIRLVVSSLSAGDDLFPGNNPGPLARECTIDKGNCSVGSSERQGPHHEARKVSSTQRPAKSDRERVLSPSP